MSGSLHRTDVEYVWPTALVRPSDVRLVYLDQNHWINLAKARARRPAGGAFRDFLTVLREARRSGRVVFPLSLTHVMETCTRPRRQRFERSSPALMTSLAPWKRDLANVLSAMLDA